jgi:hypothetical protein
MSRIYKSQQESQILISVLLVTIIVFTLGAAVLFHVRSYHDISELQHDTDQAYALAKSGINIADNIVKSVLDQGPCNYTKDDTYTLGAGTVRIQINTTLQNIAGEYRVSGDITSTGCVDKSQRVLEKTIDSPVSGWVKIYGDEYDDYLYALQQTSGGYIFAGQTYSLATHYEFLLVKTDPNGNVGASYPGTWAKTYGGNAGDVMHSFQQTTDGGYIFDGGTASFGGWKLILVKTYSDGIVDWAKTYTGANWSGSFRENIHSLQQISNGFNGYIFGGFTYSTSSGWDFYVIRTDSSGNVGAIYPGTWAKTYGGDQADYLRVLQQTSDGYILGGDTWSFGAGSGGDFLLIKTNSDGAIDWAKTYTNSDKLRVLQQTSDGYILGGDTNLGAGQVDFLVIKTNSTGDVIWAKTYGGSNWEQLYFLQQTADGGYILGGDTSSFGQGGNDLFLIRIDSGGDVLWAKTYGPNSDGRDYLRFLQQTSDGYILGGDTKPSGAGGYYDIALNKVGSLGGLGCCGIVDDVILTAGDVTSFIIANPITPDEFNATLFISPVTTLNTNDIDLTITQVCPQ